MVSSLHPAKQKMHLRLRRYVFCSVFYFILVALVALLTRLPIFYFEHITVSSAESIDAGVVLREMQGALSGTFFGRYLGYAHLLALLDAPELRVGPFVIDLNTDFLRRTMEFVVIPIKHFLVWCAGGEHCVWVDEDGQILERAYASDGQLVVTVYEDTPTILIPTNLVLPKEEMRTLRNLLLAFRDLHIALRRLDFRSSSRDFFVASFNYPALQFNLRTYSGAMKEALMALMLRSDFKQFSIVDLRVPGKIYYRL